MKLAEYRKKNARTLFTCLSKNLKGYNYNSAILDIDILLSSVLEKERAWILSYGDVDLSESTLKKLDKFISLRLKGKPIAYILKSREFYGLDFFVDERVLIPKSDTEIVVEKALSFCLKNYKSPSDESFCILDLCSGSGCISIALVKNMCKEILNCTEKNKPPYKKIIVDFQDISRDTLDLAAINANKLLNAEIDARLVEIDFHCQDLKLGFAKKYQYDCIVSNPPYVPSKVVTKLLEDGRSEPRLALDGGNDGLDLYPYIATYAYQSLKSNGAFFVEAGEYNLDAAIDIFKSKGFTNIKTYRDLSAAKRVFSGNKR